MLSIRLEQTPLQRQILSCRSKSGKRGVMLPDSFMTQDSTAVAGHFETNFPSHLNSFRPERDTLQ